MLHPDGVFGRTLLLPDGATFTVPLKLSGEALFSGRAMLLPHDWRDGRGAVRASVAVMDGGGQEHELWAGTLRASGFARPRGLHVDCRLPPFTTSLQLRIRVVGVLREQSVARAIWWEPAIIDPDAPRMERLPPGSGSVERLPRRPVAPLISVLTPVHDPPAHMLEEAITSVQKQTFTDWELCLVDDGSANQKVIAVLERHAASDPRIHLKRRATAVGISAATNTALDLASGEYIALLDHDDSLAPDALRRVADRIAAATGSRHDLQRRGRHG